MSTRRSFLITAAGAAGATLLAPFARAADAWPQHPIRFVVPYPPGGPLDGMARVVTVELANQLGQPIVVENRAGAGGSIGLYYAIKAQPDGSIFGFGVPGAITVLPQLQQQPYSAQEINYVSLVGRAPSAIAVHESLKVNTLKELIALAKEKPGKLNYGSTGAGTTPHLGAELLKQEAHIDMAHIPYAGAAPAITALLAGEIQMLCSDLAGLLPFASRGLKLLAVCYPERVPQVPDVPTTAELGLPGVKMESDYGIIAPNGTPKAITDKLLAAVTKVLAMPEIKQKIAQQGAIAQSSTPAEYRKMMLDETEKWRKVIKAGNIKLG